jgi:soluble lytic murein transglycosylase
LQGSKNTELLQTVARKSWTNLDFTVAQEKTFLAQYGSHLNQPDHRKRVEQLLKEPKLDQAKRMVPLLSKENKAWAQARFAFLEDHPNPHSFLEQTKPSHDLIFEQIRWHRKRDDLAGAHLLKSIPAKHTEDSVWWRERSYFAREALNQGNPQLAYELMSSHPYADGAEFADAEFFCGWVALKHFKNSDKAIAHFKKFAVKATLPKSKAKASFWLARAYDAKGNKELAEAAYRETAKHPTTFYGMVAKRKFEKNVKLNFSREPTMDPKQWTQFQNKEFVRLARLLQKAGMSVEAEPFLFILAKSTAKASKAEKAMVLKTIQDVYSPYTIFASKDLRYQADDFPWLYPRRSLGSKVKHHGVDHHLIHAVMRQESGFNTRALSPAGAMGLMQLMPKTASGLAKRLGLTHKDSRLHSDPDYNIVLGSRYLKEMLDQFQGSHILAVAAYNCGPGPVQKWIAKYGDPRTGEVDITDFIESIPYGETREYVKSVMANYEVYMALERP